MHESSPSREIRRPSSRRSVDRGRENQEIEDEPKSGPRPVAPIDKVILRRDRVANVQKNNSEKISHKATMERVTEEIKLHFYNIAALRAYVAYLKDKEKQKPFNAAEIELPSGKNFNTLRWNQKDISHLIAQLDEDVKNQELIAFASGKIREVTPTDEDLKNQAMRHNAINQGIENERMEQRLTQLIQQEDTLQTELHKAKSSQTLRSRFNAFIDRLRGTSSASAEVQKVKTLEHDLRVLQEEQHQIEEDIQMMRYNQKIAQQGGSHTDIRWTPKNITEAEAQERKRKEETEENQQTAKALSALQPGISTLAEAEREYEIPVPPSQEMKNARLKPMNVQEAQIFVPQAARMWETVHEKIKEYPEAARLINALPHMREWYISKGKGIDDPAQNYVYAVAKLIRATRAGDTEFADQIATNIGKVNAALELSDAEYQSLLGGYDIQIPLRGTRERQRIQKKRDQRTRSGNFF